MLASSSSSLTLFSPPVPCFHNFEGRPQHKMAQQVQISAHSAAMMAASEASRSSIQYCQGNINGVILCIKFGKWNSGFLRYYLSRKPSLSQIVLCDDDLSQTTMRIEGNSANDNYQQKSFFIDDSIGQSHTKVLCFFRRRVSGWHRTNFLVRDGEWEVRSVFGRVMCEAHLLYWDGEGRGRAYMRFWAVWAKLWNSWSYCGMRFLSWRGAEGGDAMKYVRCLQSSLDRILPIKKTTVPSSIF